ncbi:flagellar hook-associated protein FlgK [Thiorhodococcus minor]|uniref:Flagellar hook-associated protein 1 n=1 Tax=Thiorhodococcus minor TaxID=57489 RepID=A0A6M0JWL7_9GAMM|nr:flagellar hook-associated protein FlgK [Thiorhodococcus minor]NEV60535.1 flagellar hook-associated protein FlgK [Thiorhodococcus minor]
MSILGTAVSGLLAYQRALATTSHNISNASTEGYSRQRVELESRNPQMLGGSYVGQGVNVSTIRRLQDDLVDAHLRASLTDSANGEVRAAFAERVDQLLADETTGLEPVLESYFSAVQDVANDPTSMSARTVMLNEAETLVERFSHLDTQLDEQRALVNGQIETAVEEINQYAKSLAALNLEIVSGYSGGSAPNDLLDRRDNLLNHLAERVDITVNAQDDGSVNVFIGNGQQLVMRGGSNELVAEHLSADPENLDIGLKSRASAEPIDITRFMTGGELGALLETRTSILDTSQNQLGLIGLNLAARFNEQNALGLDLDGQLGQAIFGLPEVAVSASPDNDSASIPDVTISDVSTLTASDYRLTFNGTDFGLKRLSDNQVVALDDTTPGVLVGDGLTIDVSGLGDAEAGDDWLVQPTRFAAEGLSVEMTDPADIAAISGALADDGNQGEARVTGLRTTVSPLTADGTVPATVITNDSGDTYNLLSAQYGPDSGSAQVESFDVVDPQDAGLLTATTISYDAVEGRFDVDGELFTLDPSGTTTISMNGWELRIRGEPDDGAAFTIGVTAIPVATPQPAQTTIAGSGWELDIEGQPAAGDMFRLDLSAGREGDNRNLLVMAGIPEERLIEDRSTIQGGYDDILSEVGTQTRQAQIARDSSATVLEAAQAQREAISGVNLDEEAANLIRFQQAYQASAQVIATTQTIFDTLINAVR